MRQRGFHAWFARSHFSAWGVQLHFCGFSLVHLLVLAGNALGSLGNAGKLLGSAGNL